MKSYRLDDSIVLRLPKVKLKDSIKEKSCFVDHNRRSYVKDSLDDLDLSWLNKSKNKKSQNK